MTCISLTDVDIVTEFMAKGNLLDLLKNKQELIRTDDLIMMAKQTASGNVMLEDNPSRNVILGHRKHRAS